jgi:hypothetical protein
MWQNDPGRYRDETGEIYLDLIQSGMDRPQGCEQSAILDMLADRRTEAHGHVGKAERRGLRLGLRWLVLPRLPLPVLIRA